MMNFDITYTKQQKNRTIKSKYFVLYVNDDENLVKNILEQLNKLINHKYWEIDGYFSISTEVLSFSFKNIEIIIKCFHSNFDFNIFKDEIYKNINNA